MEKKRRLLELGQVPVFYADEIISAEIVSGTNARITMGEHLTINGEAVVCPNLVLVQPLASCPLAVRDILRRGTDSPDEDRAQTLLPFH